MRGLRYDPPLNLAVWDELCELCFKPHLDNCTVFNLENSSEKVWEMPVTWVRKDGSKKLLWMGTNERFKYQNHCGWQVWEETWHLFVTAGRSLTINRSWCEKTLAQIIHFFEASPEKYFIHLYFRCSLYLCNGLFHLWLTEGRKCRF